MIKFNSMHEWKDYCFNANGKYLKNGHFRKWISKKEIDIINLSDLREGSIRHIRLGIGDAIKLLGLHFKVRCGKATGRKLSGFISKNSAVSSSKLLKMIMKSRKQNNNENANVLIVSRPVESLGSVIEDGEALTFVSEGATIFAFSRSRKYPGRFLRRRARHEALHLLGLNFHHEDTKIRGWPGKSPCNMEYNAPVKKVCRKCKGALQSFWKGIEYATKQKFITG